MTVTGSRPGALAGAILVALLLAGCGSMPDLERGRAALKSGDDIAAEGDLRPLAEMGYVEAQLRLARIHADRGSPQDIEEALYWYRKLAADDPTVNTALARALIRQGTPDGLREAEQILRNEDARGDPAALAALVELLAAHPELDPKQNLGGLIQRAEAMKSPEVEPTIIRWYRRNAGGGKLSAELLQRCREALARVPECAIDLARHYRAVGADRELEALTAESLEKAKAGTMPPEVMQRLGWALVDDESEGKAHPKTAHALLKMASQQSVVGSIRLARLLIDYPQLDPAGKPEQLLLAAAAKGHPEASLALGQLYMGGSSVPPDADKAEYYLRQAAASQPSANYYLGRLYKRGDLGKADPVGAARHFLTAARNGYPKADFALAELFSDNRGVKPNLPNAYSFASLATAHSIPDAAALQLKIQSRMSPGQLAEAQTLMKKEIEIRNAAAKAAAAQAASTPQEASR